MAKIVLPKELFSQTTQTLSNTTSKTTAVSIPFSNTAFSRLEQNANSRENIQALSLLKNELLQAQIAYQKEYQKAYDLALADYKKNNKAILDQYKVDVELARSQFCSTLPTGTVYDENNPCHKPALVPEPVLSEFVFNFKNELSTPFLTKQLSVKSLELYQTLIAEENFEIRDITSKFFNSTSINAFNSGIDDLISHENQIISDNTIDTGSTSVVIGGSTIIVPNENEINSLLPFEYEVSTRYNTLTKVRTLQIMLGISNSTSKVASVKYKMTKTDATFSELNSTNISHFFDYDALFNLAMPTINTNLSELKIDVNFLNGKIGTITIPNFSLTTIYKAFIAFPLEVIDNDNSPNLNTTIVPNQTYIPVGFGVKQLGIADYNKVEQTLQGYIEGEVAHIENIMAREFKEKSTHRLRKSETTESTSSENEREQLTDTTTTTRFEMQNEVSKVLANSKDFGGGVNASYNSGAYSISANANFATHNSKEQNAKQAVTNAKEITERALDRIVNKVKEERIEKVIEEFEENNTHGFDNRRGDKHVVGVYRWVDKVFKNQIVTYGKRLMFEFMIPEPARLHGLAMKTIVGQNNAKSLVKPEDPRTSIINKLENYSQLDEAKLKYWTGKYNVEVGTKLEQYIFVGKNLDFSNNDPLRAGSKSDSIQIPDGYQTTNGSINFLYASGGHYVWAASIQMTIGNFTQWINGWEANPPSFSFPLNKFTGSIPIGLGYTNMHSVVVSYSVKCELTEEAKTKWQIETFNAIIEAYEDALQRYNEELETQQTSGVQILGTNPGFYREIENIILRKNCISYIISSNPNTLLTFGKDFYTKNNSQDASITFQNGIINQSKDLDDYASFVKFIEQAFEWDIMSYNFYPYYWGSRNNWLEMYQYDQTHDHLFKAFMQSGMARVIITVRPGFEDAVQYYMQTGQIWNGGEVPVIGDELYLSIVDELKTPEGEKVGKAWPSRVPTSMTILQADSIGLKVDRALPFNDDLSDFEFPDQVPQSTQLLLNENQIGGGTTGTAKLIGIINGNDGKNAKIVLKTIDGDIQDLTYSDDNGNWELEQLPAGKYELFLDFNNDFPETAYQVTQGEKEQVVELENTTTTEVNITYATLV